MENLKQYVRNNFKDDNANFLIGFVEVENIQSFTLYSSNCPIEYDVSKGDILVAWIDCRGEFRLNEIKWFIENEINI